LAKLRWWNHSRALAFLADIKFRQRCLKRADIALLIDHLDKQGNDQALYADFGHLKGLYQECVRKRWFKERFEKVLQDKAAPLEQKPNRPKLSITTARGVNVFVEDKKIEIPLAKSLEVLLWLAIQGTSTRGEILKGLWLEPEDTKSGDYFRVAVRRLRMELNSHPSLQFDPIPFVGSSYCISDALELDLDIAPLLKAIEEQTSEPAALEVALKCYDHNLFKGCEGAWFDEMRENLAHQAMQFAGILNENLWNAGNPKPLWFSQMFPPSSGYDETFLKN
jgi:two-component SAPR family response regulator